MRKLEGDGGVRVTTAVDVDKEAETFKVSILHSAFCILHDACCPWGRRSRPHGAVSPVVHSGCSANISKSFLLGPWLNAHLCLVSTQGGRWALRTHPNETQTKHSYWRKRVPSIPACPPFPLLMVSPQERGEEEFLSKDERIWGRDCPGEQLLILLWELSALQSPPYQEKLKWWRWNGHFGASRERPALFKKLQSGCH